MIDLNKLTDLGFLPGRTLGGHSTRYGIHIISNDIDKFIRDKCVLSKNSRVTFSLLYRSYVDWCSNLGTSYCMSRSVFAHALETRGVIPRHGTGNRAERIGICLAAI